MTVEMDIPEQKRALRTSMTAWRDTITSEQRAETAAALAWAGLTFARPMPAGAVRLAA